MTSVWVIIQQQLSVPTISPCSISHQSVCNILIITLINRPPHHQPCSPTQHRLWKPVWDLKMEWLIELWCSGPAVLHKLHIWYPETWLHAAGLLLSNQSSREVSVQHPLSFIPLLSSSLHPAVSYRCVPPLISNPQTRKSEQLTPHSHSLSTQAENMIAGRPAKHEMSGGSRLLYNPLTFKLDWLVVQYGSCSDIMSSKYK